MQIISNQTKHRLEALNFEWVTLEEFSNGVRNNPMSESTLMNLCMSIDTIKGNNRQKFATYKQILYLSKLGASVDVMVSLINVVTEIK